MKTKTRLNSSTSTDSVGTRPSEAAEAESEDRKQRLDQWLTEGRVLIGDTAVEKKNSSRCICCHPVLKVILLGVIISLIIALVACASQVWGTKGKLCNFRTLAVGTGKPEDIYFYLRPEDSAIVDGSEDVVQVWERFCNEAVVQHDQDPQDVEVYWGSEQEQFERFLGPATIGSIRTIPGVSAVRLARLLSEKNSVRIGETWYEIDKSVADSGYVVSHIEENEENEIYINFEADQSLVQ